METEKLSELEIFAENVRFLRMHYRYTKKAMAEIMGIGVATLNKLENGIIPERIGVSCIYSVSKHFVISISSLFAKRS